MLPPGLFQPSHPSTVNSVGCLAMYPPVRIWIRASRFACEGAVGTSSCRGVHAQRGSWGVLGDGTGRLLSVEDRGDGGQRVSVGVGSLRAAASETATVADGAPRRRGECQDESP